MLICGGNVKVSEKSKGPLTLTKSYHNSYGTDYVNVPTNIALNISDLIMSDDNSDQILLDFE